MVTGQGGRERHGGRSAAGSAPGRRLPTVSSAIRLDCWNGTRSVRYVSHRRQRSAPSPCTSSGLLGGSSVKPMAGARPRAGPDGRCARRGPYAASAARSRGAEALSPAARRGRGAAVRRLGGGRLHLVSLGTVSLGRESFKRPDRGGCPGRSPHSPVPSTLPRPALPGAPPAWPLPPPEGFDQAAFRPRSARSSSQPLRVASSVPSTLPSSVSRTGLMPAKFRMLRSMPFSAWAPKNQR